MSESDDLKLSRVTALVLMAVYGAYLYFQLKTHSAEFAGQVRATKRLCVGGWGLGVKHALRNAVHACRRSMGPPSPQHQHICTNSPHHCAERQGDGDETPSLSLCGSLVCLLGITGVVALASEYLTGAIQEVSSVSGISSGACVCACECVVWRVFVGACVHGCATAGWCPAGLAQS